jgi:hypothetical protein
MSALEVINYILILLSQLLRFIGLAVLGAGMGWLALDLLKKISAWQGQVAIYLGLLGLIIAMTVFTGWGAIGAFAAGVGVAVFMWGMPKKEKPE